MTTPTYPGYINVLAIDAAHREIQSAMVHKNVADRRAVIELGFYPGVSREQQSEAALASRDAVLAFLGEGWAATFRKG